MDQKWNFSNFLKFRIFFNEIVLKLFYCAPRLEKRENSRNKFENRSILANFIPSSSARNSDVYLYIAISI
jgi:hypothetical protein